MKHQARLAALLMAVAAIGTSAARTAYGWVCSFEDAQGNCYTWPQNQATFYINVNAFETAFGGDSHLAGVNWEAYIVHAARAWAEGSGSAINLIYGGTTTRPCAVNNDGYNVVGVQALPGIALGVTWNNPDEENETLSKHDICIDTPRPWSVRNNVPPDRFDLRHTLLNEFGHFFGAGDLTGDDEPIMFESQAMGVTNHELWGYDKAFIRYHYGHRAHAVYGRPFHPPSSWDPAWQTLTFTNLPIGAATGRDDAGAFWVVRAEANTSRTGVRFRRTPYPASSSSSWTSTFYSATLEHGPALTASTWDKWWVTAWPLVDTYRGCNGLRIGVSDDLFETAYFFTEDEICTSHEVALTYHDAGAYIMAYVANGFGAGGQLPGRVYIRTSLYGTYWPDGAEVYAGLYADSDISVACTVHGLCGLSVVRGDTNQRYDRQRAFTLDSFGSPVMGTIVSHSNWVYHAPQLFVSTYGSQPPDTTFLFMDFTNITTGAHTQWYMSDGDFPVVGSWSALGYSNVLRSSIAFNPDRHYSTLFFLP